MTFEAWLEERHSISHKTFELRHLNVQIQMVEEYNQYNRDVKNDKMRY